MDANLVAQAMWYPIENNPEVMNDYLVSLGVKEPKVEFVDVYGVSPDFLAMLPRPVHAVLFVYPLCSAIQKKSTELLEAQKDEAAAFSKGSALFFTHQLVANACGTIAMMHAVMNNFDKLGDVSPGSVLDVFRGTTKPGADPSETGVAVALSADMAAIHSEAAAKGATLASEAHLKTNLHFTCFVFVGGRCVELDGRQPNPMLHASCEDSEAFLNAAAAAIQEKMSLNPDAFEFSITALVERQAS